MINSIAHFSRPTLKRRSKWRGNRRMTLKEVSGFTKDLIYQKWLSMQRCSCHSDEFSINQLCCLDRNERIFRGMNKFPLQKGNELESNNKFRLINLHLECASFSPQILNQNLNFLEANLYARRKNIFLINFHNVFTVDLWTWLKSKNYFFLFPFHSILSFSHSNR